ncbi:MAG: hypothetical protein PHI48_12710 [Bacteroidales bacterium]|nr:hypothetical protein [Bacteroidales bacterium]MDD4823405.1 hypothetical protein [Bacteroidales bacterium]
MKKIIALSCVLSISLYSFSQGEMDAYKYSTTELSGTARSMSMGGAFGALGGDISTMSTNPGGLGIYRSSEFVISPMLRYNTTKATKGGYSTDDSKVNAVLQNFGFVGSFYTGNTSGLLNLNFGFALNRLANFNRNTTSRGFNQATSISDYIAYKTNSTNNWQGENVNNLDATDAYTSGTTNWMSALGYGSGMISEDNVYNNYYLSSLSAGETVNSRLNMEEKGWIDEYALSMAGNINNIVYAGLTVGIQDLNYSSSTLYSESSTSSASYLELGNFLETTGTGWNLKLGLLFRPLSFMRLGIAYHTPTFYNLSDYYYASASSDIVTLPQAYSDNTEEGVYDYKLQTPGKLLLSYAVFIDNNAVLSIDYDYSDYGSMKLDAKDYNTSFDADNDLIKTDFKGAHTFRIGGEVKVDPTISLRAGWATTSSCINASIKDEKFEVPTSGTLPHYYFDNGRDFYTLGVGFRFHEFFLDVAYIHKVQNLKVYDFSPYFVVKDNPALYTSPTPATYTPYGLTLDDALVGSNLNYNQPAKVKDHTNSLMVTLGVKF